MSKDAPKRKLATILATDVVGYSRLLGQDEEGTIAALAERRNISDALIARHGGRIFNTAGDSVMAEFASAVEAVRAAVEIQEEITALDADVPKERRMRFRMGSTSAMW